MGTRAEQREARRQERLERERSEAAGAARRRRLTRLGAVVAAAVVLVVAGILISRGGDEPSAGTAGEGGLIGAAETKRLLEDIPQSGNVLGSPDAKVTLVEYADLQCPFCADYAIQVLPQIIERYVRPGKVRLDLRVLRFLGADSDRGARAAVVAARQDRMWNFVDLFYRNQGEENSGFVTEDFVRRLGDAIPGIEDPGALVSEGNEAAVERRLVAFDDAAAAAGIESTPSFEIARGRGAPERLGWTRSSPSRSSGRSTRRSRPPGERSRHGPGDGRARRPRRRRRRLPDLRALRGDLAGLRGGQRRL
jgi:hypothetical protein